QDGSRLSPEGAWKELAIKISRLARGSSHMPVDVFLLLREPVFELLYDYGHLEKILDDARNHSWGGNTYLAWDQISDMAFDKLYGGNPQIIEEWFLMLAHSGLTDLIEIPGRSRSNGEGDESKTLSACALQSEYRRRILRSLVSPGGWGPILREDAYLLGEFTKKLIERDLLPPDTTNQAVFYHRKPGRRQGMPPLLDKANHLNRWANRFVAAVPGIDPKVLKELWKMEPVVFNGIFEWLYALVRLKQAVCPSPTAPPPEGYEHCIVPVEDSHEKKFHSGPNDGPPRLLVTSAFHPSKEPHHCIGAAKEIGALLRNLPFHLEVQVHPSITCELFPDLLEAGPFTAWLHISHGDRKEGLYEDETRQYAGPDRWLRCFNTYRGSLQLVILSACESASIAELFAQSGTCVAIGFENTVLVTAARLLTEIVIPAAFYREDTSAAILDAFREACGRLDIRTTESSAYSDALPKAFRIDTKTS
ncbi:MAG TPA: hypothetical protein VEZ90_09265, partial [Blastocatellia bacterium]|nr:hypothetical protein [Blastocatellia bacterium]